MRAVVAILVVVAACGGGGEEVLPADAPPGSDGPCPPPPGRHHIMNAVRVMPAGEGFDLDGDGEIDNAVGDAPPAALDSANQGLATAVETGEFLMVFTLTQWDPPSADDPDVAFHAFQVYDADMPPDPSDNYAGAGRFLVALSQLDLSCQSKTEADQTSMVGGIMTAENDLWRFTFLSGLGAFEFADAKVVADFSDDFRTAQARLGAVTSLCSLSDLTYPGETSGTVLDAFINDPTIRDAVRVDVDFDGDGFERVEGDGVTVLRCIDGDGATVIDGADCPCHPAIVDGYSLTIDFEIIVAEVVGVI